MFGPSKGIITLDTINELGTADYPWQNTYLIIELLRKVESLENRVAEIELARLEAMGASESSNKLNSIKELAEELQQVAEDILAAAWKED